MKRLILASSSSSRREILEETKFPFDIFVSNYEEDMTLKLDPKELAIYLSKGKAYDVAINQKGAIILAADSFGAFNGELLGKPHTFDRAKQMLELLSGQCHSFITGFTVLDADTNREYSEAVETKVYFKILTKNEIEDYLENENVLEKAGAYTIQGLGKKFIEKIEGDCNNVRGLPLTSVTIALSRFGIDLKSSGN
jgi:septum formation protein